MGPKSVLTRPWLRSVPRPAQAAPYAFSFILASLILVASLANTLRPGRWFGPGTLFQASSENSERVGSSLRQDKYGGLLDVRSPKGGARAWRTEKFGNGWMFVTPDGNAFWSFGVFAVDVDDHVDNLGGT